MNKEYQFVIKPLLKFLRNQKTHSRIFVPRYHTSATGWDIEARSKNIDLLIEAKHLSGPFLSKLTGLVSAPLVNRKRHLPKRNKKYAICWAFGGKNIKRNPFQLLWDYFIRNPVFWEHYQTDLSVKYIFLVNGGRVSRLEFRKFLTLSSKYKHLSEDKKLSVRRNIATELIRKHFYKVYKTFYKK